MARATLALLALAVALNPAPAQCQGGHCPQAAWAWASVASQHAVNLNSASAAWCWAGAAPARQLTVTLPAAYVPPLPPAAQAVVVPVGHHAHRTVDGRVIVHSDANHGSAVAHQGVAYPWPKVAYAGQVVYVQQPCPGGHCPPPRR